MMWRKFVQSGDYQQSEDNGMGPYPYSIGASVSNSQHTNFCIMTEDGLSGHDWSIPDNSSTTFKLEFIMDYFDEIPF